VPTFFSYAIADGLYNLLFPDKAGIESNRAQEIGITSSLILIRIRSLKKTGKLQNNFLDFLNFTIYIVSIN